MRQGLNHSNVSNLKHDDQTISQPIKVGEDDWGKTGLQEILGDFEAGLSSSKILVSDIFIKIHRTDKNTKA